MWPFKKKEEKIEVADNKVNEREIAFNDESNAERIEEFLKFISSKCNNNVIVYHGKMAELLKWCLINCQKLNSYGCFERRITHWLINDIVFELFDYTLGGDEDVLFFRKINAEDVYMIDFVFEDNKMFLNCLKSIRFTIRATDGSYQSTIKL